MHFKLLLLSQGVLSNKSNMLQVFAHDDAYSHATWAKAALKNVFESGVSREQLVLTANLSLCKSREQLRSQIERALSVTGLEVIDMCTFQVRVSWTSNHRAHKCLPLGWSAHPLV